MAAEGAGCHRLGGHDREAHRRWHAWEEDARVTAFPYSGTTRLLKDSTVIPALEMRPWQPYLCTYIYIYLYNIWLFIDIYRMGREKYH